MCCKLQGSARNAWLMMVAAAIATACGLAGRAFADEPAEHEEGRIVDMDADGSTERLELKHRQDLIADDEAPAAPAYWLGIHGHQPLQNDVLRTHLQLAEGVGVVIADIVPGSPAEKAGLRRHDVLIEVGGEQISDMAVLQKAVADSKGKALELKIIRLAKEMTVEVTPEAAPADLAMRIPQAGGAAGEAPSKIQDMLEQLQQNGIGGGVRVFGPGMVFNGQRWNLAQVPSNVQVTITRENDGPAKVTVKRGEETWTLEGDDQEELAKLPDDVRPFVEQMLQGGQNGAGMLGGHFGGLDLKFDGRDLEALRESAESLIGGDEAHEGRLQQRLEEMEKRLERFEKQFQENSGQEADESSEPSA
jgi:hypothetical protein